MRNMVSLVPVGFWQALSTLSPAGVKITGDFVYESDILSRNKHPFGIEDKTLTAGANVFFDKTLGSLTAGTVTPVIGTPDTKTFFAISVYGVFAFFDRRDKIFKSVLKY